MASSPAKHKSSHHHHHHHHRDQHHSSSSGGHSSSSSVKSMLNFPSYIKIQDNSKLLPRYSVALSKPHDECMPMDELDGIQMELETLLSAVALRYRVLKTEHDSLEDRKHQKRSADKDKEKASSPSISSGKRKREEKKSTSSSSKDARRYSQHAKHSKLKGNSSNSPGHSHHTDHSADVVVPYPNPNAGHSHTNPKPISLKNDIPYKFWLSVEPYCIPITQEDIKMLDDLIDDFPEPLVPPVPELGAHYSIRWASDDLREEQEAANVNAKSSKRSNSTSVDASDSPKKGSEKDKERDKEKDKDRDRDREKQKEREKERVKEKEKEKVKDKDKDREKDEDKDKIMGQGICGPLTQRLVSAMLEDNAEMQSDIVGCSDTIGQDGVESSNENNASSANGAQTSSIASLLKGGIDVENRLKKELLDLGILDASDFEKDKEDEVLSEINRVRTELQAISQYNRNELKLLRAAAKEEMKRLEVKRKLDRIDKEIIEAHKRVFAAKQKRRPLTKHERNEIFRLVSEQKRLSDQLEAMPIPGFNFTVGSTDSPSSSKTETASNTQKA